MIEVSVVADGADNSTEQHQQPAQPGPNQHQPPATLSFSFPPLSPSENTEEVEDEEEDEDHLTEDGDLPAYEDVVEDDMSGRDPPPSYSMAEGLDQLPSYRETGVNRARIGQYIFIYDKSNAKFKTFKK